jgi:hypothetical protein
MIPSSKQKGILFLSASASSHAQHLLDGHCPDILVSYHYIRKQAAYKTIIPEITRRGGFFMTDSGAFSLLAEFRDKGIPSECKKEEYWLPYINEYVQYLEDNAKYIYTAANMDLDNIVGRELVDKWNHKYFKPLESKMEIIYNVQKDSIMRYGDPTGVNRFREYAKQFSYLAINNDYNKEVARFSQLSRILNVRLHGFALTGIKDIITYPYFSRDSTTWLMGARYGNTFVNKGSNFRVWDGKKKYLHKSLMNTFTEYGDYDGFIKDDQREVNMHNISAWLELREKYLKMCDLKLHSKPCSFYDKRTI